jgi:hypothetical protein
MSQTFVYILAGIGIYLLIAAFFLSLLGNEEIDQSDKPKADQSNDPEK